jgi:hypothetical protein
MNKHQDDIEDWECADMKNQPAFPAPAGVAHITEQGMDLRDYFAAKAMQAMLSRHESITCPDEILAQDAYNTADAMMEAREKNDG